MKNSELEHTYTTESTLAEGKQHCRKDLGVTVARHTSDMWLLQQGQLSWFCKWWQQPSGQVQVASTAEQTGWMQSRGEEQLCGEVVGRVEAKKPNYMKSCCEEGWQLVCFLSIKVSRSCPFAESAFCSICFFAARENCSDRATGTFGEPPALQVLASGLEEELSRMVCAHLSLA